MSPPQPGYLVQEIYIADSTGIPTKIIGATGGLQRMTCCLMYIQEM